MAGGRPDVVRWLYYAYGGRLGPRYAQWVLRDLTGKWWMVRHIFRTLSQCAPAALLLLFPARPEVSAEMIGIVVFGALYYAISFADEIRDHKLYKHGFVPELLKKDDPE
jgi:hypothetical protein